MINMTYGVGRINGDIIEKDNEVNLSVTLKEPVGDDTVETVVPLKLKGAIAKHTTEYCKKGDLIGYKGSIRNTENGFYVLVDKITFLASKTDKED